MLSYGAALKNRRARKVLKSLDAAAEGGVDLYFSKKKKVKLSNY
jgi:hypothetical protein